MNRLQRVVRAWYDGWQRFAAVAGGGAEDFVGPNPWKRDR